MRTNTCTIINVYMQYTLCTHVTLKCKNISFKMLKGVGMVVPKSKKQDCNNPSGATYATKRSYFV